MAKSSRYKQNRLQQLRGFCATVQTGSVTEAARRTHLSQPSVSLQIRALEDEFGCALFERQGRILKVTAEGKALYRMSMPLIEQFDALRNNFDADRKELVGQITVAAGEATLLYVLPRFVKRFCSAHPQVEFRLLNVTGRDGVALLRSGEIDFAVGTLIQVPDDIEFRPVFKYDPVLITPLGHPLSKRRNITLEEISTYPLILPPSYQNTWKIVHVAFQRYNLTPKVKLEAQGWEIIKRYVEIGMGISIATSLCLTGKEKLEVINLKRYFPTRIVGVQLRRGAYISPQSRLFMEMMGA
jgi:DNA-binding transcriptional LysR family regulator